MTEAIKLLSKQISDEQSVMNNQISDAQQVMNKQISDAQGVTNKHISDSQKELAETLKSCNKSKLQRVKPMFLPKRNLEDYSLFRQFRKEFEHYISDVSEENYPDK